MTVHRARLFYSTNGAQSFHGWLGTWITNMQPWSADEVTNEVPTETTSPIDTSEEYYRLELAFDWSEDRAIILDNLDQYAASYCDWHRVAYHECSHDDANGGPCSWDEVRESGTIPDAVPTITV